MRIIDCEQRDPVWYASRLGVPTASEFGRIITPARMQYAAAADEYINALIDQRARPEAERSWGGNRHTERGCELEPEAREAYAFERDVVLRTVGFVLNDAGTLGCSPDALVYETLGRPIQTAGFPVRSAFFSGGLEVKCPDGPTHVAWMRAGGLPSDHKAQVHGSMIVTGLPWWDFVSYCPPYPLLIVRVTPDKFTEALRGCLDRFLGEYAKAWKAIEGAMA